MTTTNHYNLQPFKLKPRFVQRVWGMTDLTPWFEKTGLTEKVGEVWLTGPENLIQGGENDGRTLGDLSTQCEWGLGDGDFPLLVKILLPSEKLSVQVHPDDEQAKALGLRRGKTECWYVLSAMAGATVACGLKHGVTLGDLEAAIAAGTVEDYLEMIPVEQGDTVFIDAGTVHAIGPGVVLLEVQQTSDVTYRLFDYGRDRELHLKAGMAVVKTETRAGKRVAKDAEGYTRLIDEKYFVVDRFEIPAGTAFEMPMDGLGCIVGLGGQVAVNAERLTMVEAAIVPYGSVTMSSATGGVFARCWVKD